MGAERPQKPKKEVKTEVKPKLKETKVPKESKGDFTPEPEEQAFQETEGLNRLYEIENVPDY